MKDLQPVLQRSFDLQKPSGETVRFTVSYGPVYRSGDQFFCPVQFAGWANSPPDISGSDSLDAVLQAVALVHGILRELVRHGGRVFYPDSDVDYLLERITNDEPSAA